jgi:colanic acid/amylovoran biosynthesis glycosyltransferase
VRVAFLVYEFPVVSETFVLDQIAGIHGRGCEVEVFAQRLRSDETVRQDGARGFQAFQLLPPESATRMERVARALRDGGLGLLKDPRLIARALDPFEFGTDAWRLWRLYRVLPFLGRAPYDIVHCHFGPSGVVGMELRDQGAFHAPLITQFHGFDASSYLRENGARVYETLFAKGDLFLCVSEYIQRRLVALGCDERRTRLHRTGVDPATIPFELRSARTSDGLRVLSVGRLVEKKGFEFGLRAVALLLPRHPTLHYTVVGSGPEQESLRRLAVDLGMEGHVSFVGAKARHEVTALMRSSQLFLAPSVTSREGDEEGIPVVLMEALASGLPVVSTVHAGIPELVSHGESGLLAPERDVMALAECAEFILGHPRESEAMAEAGRRTIEDEYDVGKLNSSLLALYERVKGGGVPP